MDLNNVIGQIVMNLEPRVIIYTHTGVCHTHLLVCHTHTNTCMYIYR